MKKRKKELENWMLTRQRFHILDPLPPPKERKARPLHEILDELLKKERPEESIPSQVVEYWNIAVGEQIAQRTVPTAIKQKILYVDVDHPGWLSEARRLPKRTVLKKLNTVSNLPPIRDIRFRLAPSLQLKRRY